MKRKALWVVRVDNYFPDLCELTIPTIKKYSEKIGADYIEITERKYPEFPPTYEKLQIYDLGKSFDWNILLDADNVISPSAFDITSFLDPRVVGFMSAFDANNMFYTKDDPYFERDGRNVGIASGLVITSSLTHDLWTPLDMTAEEAKKRTKRWFIIDEYCLSRNLARFGLKFSGLNLNDAINRLFVHVGVEEEDKSLCVEKARNILKNLKII